MNQTLEGYLLAMIVPAVALAVCIWFERLSKVPTDGVLESTEEPIEVAVARPKLKLIPSRKRQPTATKPTDMQIQVRKHTNAKARER